MLPIALMLLACGLVVVAGLDVSFVNQIERDGIYRTLKDFQGFAGALIGSATSFGLAYWAYKSSIRKQKRDQADAAVEKFRTYYLAIHDVFRAHSKCNPMGDYDKKAYSEAMIALTEAANSVDIKRAMLDRNMGGDEDAISLFINAAFMSAGPGQRVGDSYKVRAEAILWPLYMDICDAIQAKILLSEHTGDIDILKKKRHVDVMAYHHAFRTGDYGTILK